MIDWSQVRQPQPDRILTTVRATYTVWHDEDDLPGKAAIYRREEEGETFVDAVPKDWSDDDILEVIGEWEADQ